MTDLRLAPSGPVIKNSGGAPLTPGSGTRLRLAEAYATAGVVSVPTVPVDLISITVNLPNLGLANPNPAYKYRGSVKCEVQNPTTNVAQAAQLYYDLSVDGGVTWVEQASNTHILAAGDTREISLNLPLKAGSLYGVTAGTGALLERVRIGASIGGTVMLLQSVGTPGSNASVGTVNVTLEETF